MSQHLASSVLQDHAYRATLAWWILAMAACAAFLITLLTIGYQAMRTALANPVHNLSAE